MSPRFISSPNLPTVVYVFLPLQKGRKNSYEWSCPCSEAAVHYVKNKYTLTSFVVAKKFIK
jgi:hypothetical protein